MVDWITKYNCGARLGQRGCNAVCVIGLDIISRFSATMKRTSSKQSARGITRTHATWCGWRGACGMSSGDRPAFGLIRRVSSMEQDMARSKTWTAARGCGKFSEM